MKLGDSVVSELSAHLEEVYVHYPFGRVSKLEASMRVPQQIPTGAQDTFAEECVEPQFQLPNYPITKLQNPALLFWRHVLLRLR
jgi:hypothetical protein